MLKRLKTLFRKKEKEETALQKALKNSVPMPAWTTFTKTPTSFQNYLNATIEHEQKIKGEAIKEVFKFEPLTQTILQELRQQGMFSDFSSLEPEELRMYRMGKIIDTHVKRGIFQKKVDDVIDG